MFQNALDFLGSHIIWFFGGSGGVLLVYFLSRFIDKRKDADEDELATIRTFPQTDEGAINNPFYKFFISKIADAHDSIFITGDGFECANEAATEASNRFHSAFRDALERVVRVVRVHTGTHAHESWAGKLADLVEEYPDNFKLYALKNTSARQLTSACVIDPDDRKNNVLEFMFQTRKFIEERSVGLAGTGVFIMGNRKSANDICEKIQELMNSKSCVPILSRSKAMELIAGVKNA